MARPVVAVDVDEVYLTACSLALNPQLTTHQVLCEFLRPLVQFHNDRVGAVACFGPPRNITMSDFHSYVFKARLSSSPIIFFSVISRRGAKQEAWGGSDDHSRAIVDAYIASPYFSQPLVPGAVEGANFVARTLILSRPLLTAVHESLH